MAAVRMEFLQRRAPRTEDVPNRTARNRCSDAARISLHHRKATTSRDAQWRPLRLVDALLANTDAVRMGLPKRREPTIRVAQELRNRQRLNQRKRSLNRARKRKKRDATHRHMVAVQMVLRQLADQMEKVVRCVQENRLDAVPMDRHRRMDLTARDVAWRLRTDAVRIISTLLVVRIWKVASVSIHRTDAVRIIRPPLVVTTTRAVGVSIRSMVVAQTRRLTLQGPTLRDVRAMRSSLDAVRMVSHRPRDRTTMVAIARTVSSSVARMDRRQRRVRTLRVALVLPASMDAAQMESTKRREANSKAAKWYPSLPRRLACSRRTWARVTTTPSSTSSTSSTEAVDDSGTVDAVETRTDSTRPMSARMCAKHRKERTSVNCPRSPDHVPGTTRCGTTTPIGTRAHSSRTVAAWVTRTGSKRWTSARARAWWMILFVSRWIDWLGFRENCTVVVFAAPCDQPKESGPCNGTFERWYFDKERDTCEPFHYGGCKGNKNNYPTESSCNYHCKKPGVHKRKYHLDVRQSLRDWFGPLVLALTTRYIFLCVSTITLHDLQNTLLPNHKTHAHSSELYTAGG